MLRDYAFLLLRIRGDRGRLLILFAGLAFTAILETMGIALVLPFVALLQGEESAGLPEALASTAAFLGLSSRKQLIFVCGVFLVAVFLFKALFVLLVFRLQMRFVFRRMAIVMRDLLASYMGRPYTFHLEHNSADLLRNVTTDCTVIFQRAIPALFVFAVEVLTCSVMILLLVALEPVAVPIASIVTGGAGFALYRLYRRWLAVIGAQAREDHGQMVRETVQALGGVKESLVMGRESFFVKEFARSSNGSVKALQGYKTLLHVPRLTLEALGVIGLVLLTLIAMVRDQGSTHLVPMLGVLAIAVVRLIPSAARMVSSLAEARYYSVTAQSIRKDLEMAAPPQQTAPEPVATARFDQEIHLADLCYSYPGTTSEALSGVSLTIRKGEAIAIVGGSGAGKTTLVDVMLGLLTPTRGDIHLDGRPLRSAADWRGWRQLIGYIPQQVYLSDDTIRRNIAFGIPDEGVDDDAVRAALAAAQLDGVVLSLPDGLETTVGERGVRLSGGQRQRIGIARALYLNPQVLVLDEATSALDGVTEAEVVEAIERARKDRTMVVIAHRLSTVRNCDRLVFLAGGKVESVGSWESLREKSADFRRMVEVAGH